MAPKHQQHHTGESGTRSIASASISFGLVSIPVRIVSTSEHSHEVHFHMIHAGCGERLKQQYVCPTHGKVDREDIAKGYELRKGVMIELSSEELDALDAVADDAIALVEFVPSAVVDPIFVERTYYLEPGRGGARPYRLLHDALEQAKLVGIARYAARGNSYVVMVRPFENGLAMHQLRYVDEIKPWPGVEDLPEPKASELTLARQLISQLEHDELDMSQYRDEVKDRVRDLLAVKAKTGETIVAPEAHAPAHIPDLMAALRASLGGPEPEPRSNGHRDGHKKARATHRRAAPRARTHRTTHSRSRAARARRAA